MHRVGRLRLDDVAGTAPRNTWVSYGTSKLANLLFTAELSRRLEAADLPTLALAAHPGWTRSNLAGNGAALGNSRLRRRLGRTAGTTLGQSTAAGALPILCAATSSSVRSGQYVGPAHLFGLSGPPRVARPSGRARDTEMAARSVAGLGGTDRRALLGGGPRLNAPAAPRRRRAADVGPRFAAVCCRRNAACAGERSGRSTRPSATITTARAPARRSAAAALCARAPLT